MQLTACTREVTYRGVPEAKWQKLTAEQKQLLVDHAYEEEVNGVK